MDMEQALLKEALELVGAYLEEQGEPLELVAIGGSGLLLLGVIQRATKDLDVIAMATNEGYLRADVLPPVLLEARAAVADHLDLDEGWLNAGPRSLLNPLLPNQGLPAGFQERVVIQSFGGLTLHLASRFDQMCFKLHAAVDRLNPEGKHVQDLRALKPTREELLDAARWTRIQDPSEGFFLVLLQALAAFGIHDAKEVLREDG
jgi:hypothetical protein